MTSADPAVDREPYAGHSIWSADRPHDGVLRLWLDTGAPTNTVTHDNHHEFVSIWDAIAGDADARAVILRGANGVFCAGGDMDFLPPLIGDHDLQSAVLEDIRGLVHGVIRCPKPIITAIEGRCGGAGLGVALLSDIPIAARTATFLDAHIAGGLACGDHAALAWPLLIGMAKAKYHLLTARALDGPEAERIGLVAVCVDDDQLHEEALATAIRIARFHPEPVALTKRAIGGWYELAMPIFEQSALAEARGFASTAMADVVASWQAANPDR